MMSIYTSTLMMPINSSNHGNAIIGTTHTGVLVVFTVITVWSVKSGAVVNELLYKH